MRGGLTILVGALMVVAGISGQASLRGTSSSLALAAFGFGVILYGVIRRPLAEAAAEKRAEGQRLVEHEQAEEHRAALRDALVARGPVPHQHRESATLTHSELIRHLELDHVAGSTTLASTVQMQDQHDALHDTSE